MSETWQTSLKKSTQPLFASALAKVLLTIYILTSLFVVPSLSLNIVTNTLTCQDPCQIHSSLLCENECSDNRSVEPSNNFVDDIREKDLGAFNTFDTPNLTSLRRRYKLRYFIRTARLIEIVISLNYSIYTTGVIIGSLFFGLGSLILAYRVFNSVRLAAKSEPVTLSFLLSIPGLRYLNNHIRYHLFNVQLQPRRRFASFVGASGSDLEFDFDFKDRKSIISHKAKKETQPRLEHLNTSQSLSNLSKARKKSVNKVVNPEANSPFKSSHSTSSLPSSPNLVTKQSILFEAAIPPTIGREEQSGDMSQMQPTLDIPVSAIEGVPEAPLEPTITDSHSIGGGFERYASHHHQPVEIIESDHSNISSLDNISQVSEAKSLPIIKIIDRSPSSNVDASKSNLDEKRQEWVRNIPIFSSEYSMSQPEMKEPSQSVPRPIESKLSKRLAFSGKKNENLTGKSPTLEQSKLSKYFNRPNVVPDSIFGAAINNGKSIANKLPIPEGDFSPPPGFGHQQGSFLDSTLGSRIAFTRNLDNNNAKLESEGNHQKFGNQSWKWFIDDDNLTDELAWDKVRVPSRSQSVVGISSSNIFPVGSGSYSTGRASPIYDGNTGKRKSQPRISLGMFDDILDSTQQPRAI